MFNALTLLFYYLIIFRLTFLRLIWLFPLPQQMDCMAFFKNQSPPEGKEKKRSRQIFFL